MVNQDGNVTKVFSREGRESGSEADQQTDIYTGIVGRKISNGIRPKTTRSQRNARDGFSRLVVEWLMWRHSDGGKGGRTGPGQSGGRGRVGWGDVLDPAHEATRGTD